MGFTGMVAFPIIHLLDLISDFSLLLKEQNMLFSLMVIILGLALTISTLDTLINAISSLIVVDGKAFLTQKKNRYLNVSRYLIILLSIISFVVASRL